jgi:hypothetical protein
MYKQIKAYLNPDHVVSITKKYDYWHRDYFYYYEILLSNNKKLYINSVLGKRTGFLCMELPTNPECLKFENYLKHANSTLKVEPSIQHELKDKDREHFQLRSEVSSRKRVIVIISMTFAFILMVSLLTILHSFISK